MQTCEECTRPLPPTEKAFVWRNKAVCALCHASLSSRAAALTPAKPKPTPRSITTHDPQPLAYSTPKISPPKYPFSTLSGIAISVCGAITILIGLIVGTYFCFQALDPTTRRMGLSAVPITLGLYIIAATFVSGITAIGFGQIILRLRDATLHLFHLRNA